MSIDEVPPSFNLAALVAIIMLINPLLAQRLIFIDFVPIDVSTAVVSIGTVANAAVCEDFVLTGSIDMVSVWG